MPGRRGAADQDQDRGGGVRGVRQGGGGEPPHRGPRRGQARAGEQVPRGGGRQETGPPHHHQGQAAGDPQDCLQPDSQAHPSHPGAARQGDRPQHASHPGEHLTMNNLESLCSLHKLQTAIFIQLNVVKFLVP